VRARAATERRICCERQACENIGGGSWAVDFSFDLLSAEGKSGGSVGLLDAD